MDNFRPIRAKRAVPYYANGAYFPAYVNGYNNDGTYYYNSA